MHDVLCSAFFFSAICESEVPLDEFIGHPSLSLSQTLSCFLGNSTVHSLQRTIMGAFYIIKMCKRACYRGMLYANRMMSLWPLPSVTIWWDGWPNFMALINACKHLVMQVKQFTIYLYQFGEKVGSSVIVGGLLLSNNLPTLYICVILLTDSTDSIILVLWEFPRALNDSEKKKIKQPSSL